MRLSAPALIIALFAASCVPNNTNSDGGSGGTVASSGGATGKGGSPSAGGATSKGGAISSGGAPSSGGSTQAPAAVDCTDVSTFTAIVNQQYGGTFISLDSNTNKNYYMMSNWWGKYASEVENISGLGFSLVNSGNVVSDNNNPMGYPSIFIGSYSGKSTKGSNLPKQVSALTSIPTIFSTNADTIGYSNYNAAYDVWFTQSSALVTGSSPGAGGAYLMVWLFKPGAPSPRQPRGSIKANGRSIDGVDGGWDVWYDSTNPPCVSYVSSAPLSSLQYDLNNFIQDAVTNQYGVTSSMYLSIVFGGFEVWGGANGLTLKNFCANVK